MMAEPFRSPLPGIADTAALHLQYALPRAFPIRQVEPVGFGDGCGKPWRQVGHHSVSCEPTIIVDTGVTIGPAITPATCASGTCAVDWPRICRTASIWSSSPCM